MRRVLSSLHGGEVNVSNAGSWAQGGLFLSFLNKVDNVAQSGLSPLLPFTTWNGNNRGFHSQKRHRRRALMREGPLFLRVFSTFWVGLFTGFLLFSHRYSAVIPALSFSLCSSPNSQRL